MSDEIVFEEEANLEKVDLSSLVARLDKLEGLLTKFAEKNRDKPNPYEDEKMPKKMEKQAEPEHKACSCMSKKDEPKAETVGLSKEEVTEIRESLRKLQELRATPDRKTENLEASTAPKKTMVELKKDFNQQFSPAEVFVYAERNGVKWGTGFEGE